MTNDQVMVVMIILGVVLVYFLLREFFCWYFKLTQIHQELCKIRKLLTPEAPLDRYTFFELNKQAKRVAVNKYKETMLEDLSEQEIEEKLSDYEFTKNGLIIQ